MPALLRLFAPVLLVAFAPPSVLAAGKAAATASSANPKSSTKPKAQAKSQDKPKAIRGKADPCTILRIVDGDTADVLIKGETERLRLLSMDTEESWPSAGKPVTPFGLETSAWAKSFLRSEEPCWVEYGHEKRDVYNRLLAYLWRKQDGEWRMYNLQAVEKGFSPYFTKYGYSEWHHDAFIAAENGAQKAQRGIWNPTNESDLRGQYLGPDGLRTWWDKRAEALKTWTAISKSRRDIIDIRQDWRRAKDAAGEKEKVTVFTAIRKADQEGAQWIGQCEGRLYEKFEIVPGPGAHEVEEALRGTIGHYRYFSGVLALGEDGKTLRLTIDQTDDIALEPPERRQSRREAN